MITRYGSHPGNSQAYDCVVAGVMAARPPSINRGVNGSYHFGNYPDNTLDLSISQAPLANLQQQGRNVVIAPAPYASGSLVAPPGIGGPTLYGRFGHLISR